MIIARIIRSDCNLIKLGKNWLPLKEHLKPLYQQNNVFTEIMLHDFKLLHLTISKLITLPHIQKTTAKTNFTNNCLMFSTSTKSTINYHKNNGPSLLCQSISLFPTTAFFALSPQLTLKKIPSPYIYKSTENNPENARTKSREKRKKHFKLCNQLSKFFEEARITRSIWNRIMS